MQDDNIDKEDRPGTSQGMPQSGRPLSPVEVSSLLAVTTDTYGDDDDYAGSVTDVAEIGTFLQNAPGRLCPYSLTSIPGRRLKAYMEFKTIMRNPIGDGFPTNQTTFSPVWYAKLRNQLIHEYHDIINVTRYSKRYPRSAPTCV